jgi:hypothetical protein
LTTAEVVEKCGRSVALIKNRFRTGSGFLIGPGVVLTSAHVVWDDLAENVTVSFPSGTAGSNATNVRLLYVNRKRDLALLKVETTLPPLPLAGKEPQSGDKVVVLGCSASGDEPSGSASDNSGELNNAAVRIQGLEWLQLSATIDRDNCGGPVINSQGEVIGVATLDTKRGTKAFYGVPRAEIKKALGEAQALAAKDPGQAVQEHDFTVVFSWVSKSVGHDSAHLQLMCQIVDTAVHNGMNIPTVLMANPKIGEEVTRLTKLRQDWANRARPTLALACALKTIPKAARDRLRELWEVQNDMTDWINNPLRGLRDGTFCARSKELDEKGGQLIIAVAADLGLSVDEALGL